MGVAQFNWDIEVKKLLLGAKGYIGSAFAEKLGDYVYIPHNQVSVQNLLNLQIKEPFDCIINACGFTGSSYGQNIDAAKSHKEEAIFGNVIIPSTLVDFCQIVGIPIVHVSSGCIYNDLSGRVFTEEDEPNFDFNSTVYSFYSGTKSLAEKVVSTYKKSYICRLRMPFDHEDNERNYLSKMMSYDTLLSLDNSLTNRQDFVRCCLELLEGKHEYGTYNIVNSGHLNAEQICQIINKHLPYKNYKFFNDLMEFYCKTGSDFRSNCILSNDKLLNTGIKIDGISESIEKSLQKWTLPKLSN